MSSQTIPSHQIEKGEINFNYKYSSFFKRVYIDYILALIIVILIMIILNIDFYLKLSICLFYLFGTIIAGLISNKFYITKISIDENVVQIYYYQYNKPITKKINQNDLRLFFGAAMVTLYTTTETLVFKEKGKKILTQFQVGDWKIDKMKEVYEFFKKY